MIVFIQANNILDPLLCNQFNHSWKQFIIILLPSPFSGGNINADPVAVAGSEPSYLTEILSNQNK